MYERVASDIRCADDQASASWQIFAAAEFILIIGVIAVFGVVAATKKASTTAPAPACVENRHNSTVYVNTTVYVNKTVYKVGLVGKGPTTKEGGAVAQVLASQAQVARQNVQISGDWWERQEVVPARNCLRGHCSATPPH